MTYKHLKTGNLYTVLGIVTNCTNAADNQEMVLYKRLSATDCSSPLEFCFVREKNEFNEKFQLMEETWLRK